MSRTPSSALRRRVAVVLLLIAGPALAVGCERDDTVRGAGSIDVPTENLKFEPTARKPSKNSRAAHRS